MNKKNLALALNNDNLDRGSKIVQNFLSINLAVLL